MAHQQLPGDPAGSFRDLAGLSTADVPPGGLVVRISNRSGSPLAGNALGGGK